MEITFIIVEPSVPENVGACARALKIMGFDKMRLVNPCDHLSTPARTLAHASSDILEKAEVFDSLEAAVEDMDFIIGTTAKTRRVNHDYYMLKEVPEIITSKKNTIRSVACVFGRERTGLTNEELALCDMLTYIPMKNRYPSFNLAQAVMVYAYELSALNIKTTIKKQEKDNPNSLRNLQEKVSQILHDIEVDKNELIYHRIMERINVLGADDIHLLHSLCKFYFERKDGE